MSCYMGEDGWIVSLNEIGVWSWTKFLACDWAAQVVDDGQAQYPRLPTHYRVNAQTKLEKYEMKLFWALELGFAKQVAVTFTLKCLEIQSKANV